MTSAWLALTFWCLAADPVQATETPQTLLYVHTVPVGAEIQLDGKVLGHSDGLFPAAAGDHKVALVLQGYAPEERQLTIAEGRVTRLEVSLKTSTDAPVIEGVGWGPFRVGATLDEITKLVGPPDANPDPKNPWVRWLSQYHVDCLFAPNSGATEVRFNKGFPGALSSGIKIGSAEKEVLDRYGVPDRVVQKPKAKMVEYDGRGVLMWLSQGKVFDFTVIKATKDEPQPEAATPSETQAVPQGENLLANSSFEEGDQVPVGWRKGANIPGVRYLWDRSTAFQGKASLCLEKKDKRYFPIAQWFQVIDYPGNQPALAISVQVKAEQMTKAIVDAVFLDANEQGISHEWVAYIGAKNEGDPPATHDWKLYSGKVTVPPGTKKILIGLQDYGPGKVWFDDIHAGYTK